MKSPHPVRQVLDRVRRHPGVASLRSDERAVVSLAEAVAENTRLAQHLDRQVGELEQSLVPLLKRRSRARRRKGRDD